MSKSIIDGPRSHDGRRAEKFSKIDRETSGKPAKQTETLLRESRTRDSGEKLKRYTKIDRSA